MDDKKKNPTKKFNRAKYASLKKEISKRELSNHSRLFLFSSGEDWYKMGGNSLLIFYFEVAPKISAKPNIFPDTDYTDTNFEEGLISFRNIESLERRLGKAGVLKKVDRAEGVVAFELNFFTTEKRLKELHSLLAEEREHVISILKPEIVLAPTLYTKMRHIMKRIFEVTRKMQSYSREICGEEIMYCSKEMVIVYLSMNKGLISEQEGWPKIEELVEKLRIYMTVATELSILYQDSVISIGGEVIELKKMLKKELRKRNVDKKTTQ